MLVLTRKLSEVLFIGHDIKVQVVRITDGRVRIGIDAPPGVQIWREELGPSEEPPRQPQSAT